MNSQWVDGNPSGIEVWFRSPKTNGWRAPKWWALEKVTKRLQIWRFLVSMLDFWGVSQYYSRVLYITPKKIRRIKSTKIAKHCPYVPMKFDISVWKKSLAASYQKENRHESLPIFNHDFFRLLHFISFWWCHQKRVTFSPSPKNVTSSQNCQLCRIYSPQNKTGNPVLRLGAVEKKNWNWSNIGNITWGRSQEGHATHQKFRCLPSCFLCWHSLKRTASTWKWIVQSC